MTLMGTLVDESDWPLYVAVREEVATRLEAASPMGDRSGPYTNGLRFTNIWVETNGDFHLDLAWETNGVVEVFCRAMHTETWTNHVVWTNDENMVVTNDFVRWRQLDTYHGIPDNWTLLGTTTITNGSGSFTDTNHVPEYDRVRFYASAELADTDEDGLSDGEEWLGGTSPTDGDTDGDGLSDYDERNVHHTDPTKPDTDGDGLSDAAEILRGLDPLDRDSDHDGLDDGAEDVWQTHPLVSDSDNDGLPDGWEVDNGLNPTNAAGANGADGDPDGDGFPNSLEFLLGGRAMNPAWSGEQLAYRLCHQQNGDNQPGLRVNIQDAKNCHCGTNDTRQNITTNLSVPGLMECGYYIDLTIEGSVEDQNSGYDKVWFEAVTNTFYFEGNENHHGCSMVTKLATKQVLVFPNSQVTLRYDTVGHMYHCGAYAEIVDATVAAPYILEVSGADFLCVGETAQMEVSGVGSYEWTVSGDAAEIDSDTGLLEALAPGVVTVTVTDTVTGCTASKNIVLLNIDINGDFNRNGVICNHPNEAEPVTFSASTGIVIWPNHNDDDDDETPDCLDGIISGENDLSDIQTIKISKLGVLPSIIPEELTFELRLENPPGEIGAVPLPQNRIRIFSSKAQNAYGIVGPESAEGCAVFKHNATENELDIALIAGTGELELGIEGINCGREVLVKWIAKYDGQEIGNDTIRILVSPFFVLSNTDTATEVYVANAYGWQDFYDDVAAALAGVLPVVEYGAAFIQDSGEIGVFLMPMAQTERRLSAIGGLWGEDYADFIGIDTGYFRIGGGNTSGGGNIEASPPISGFPFGRLIVGSSLPTSLKAFLLAQKVQTDNQTLVELPVDWLLVKHIDEVMTIVPCGAGFRVLVADLQSAIELLAAATTDETYAPDDAIEVVSREQLLAYYTNHPSQVAYINSQLAAIRVALSQGLGIQESDILRVPVAFTLDMGFAKTYLPNMINMIVTKPQTGNPCLIVPDPGFQPFGLCLYNMLDTAGFAGGLTFVDTWALHFANGEAHCGSNVRRELQ